MRTKLDESSVVFSSEDSSFSYADRTISAVWRVTTRCTYTPPGALPCRHGVSEASLATANTEKATAKNCA